jgi:outer membrane protein with beta-barrel domain
MKRQVLKGVLGFIFVLGALTTEAKAQNREKAWEINPYAGVLWFDKVEGEQLLNDTWDLGFRFGYHWTKSHMVEFGFYGGATTDGLDQGIDVDLLGGQINYVYNLFLSRRDRVVGFATGGIGVVNISSFGFVSDPDLIGEQIEFTYNYGLGLRLFGGQRAGFRIDLRRTSFSDNGVDIHFLEAAVGMTIVLGGA